MWIPFPLVKLRTGWISSMRKKNHAVKMIDFLNAVVPIKHKKSEELISQDTHTGASTYKFSYSVEIVPICKDDLVVLPKKTG